MRSRYFVLLGDVVSSRTIEDENAFQHRLEMACDRINERFRQEILAALKIIKGIDEVGVVLKRIDNFYALLSDLVMQIFPQRMRFALVYDYIDVALESGDVSRMDGPSFHKASTTIEKIKRSRLSFGMAVYDDVLDAAIESQINLILLLKSQWTEKECRVIKEYERVGNQNVVAANLGVSQQAVSKVLRQSYWKEIKVLEEKLNYVIASYSQRLPKAGEEP